jgi:hypothetical protein
MEDERVRILQEGRGILEPVLSPHGFIFHLLGSGKSSGGPSGAAEYANGDRRMEFHFRFSLGLVIYHLANVSMDHDWYMRATLGPSGGNKYPSFSDDPLEGFGGLAHDLSHFGAIFLTGNREEFSRYAALAEAWKKIPGLARIPQR